MHRGPPFLLPSIHSPLVLPRRVLVTPAGEQSILWGRLQPGASRKVMWRTWLASRAMAWIQLAFLQAPAGTTPGSPWAPSSTPGELAIPHQLAGNVALEQNL